MDINVIVQYGTLAAAAVALWQVFYTRSKDRDEDTRWRTEADIKLDSIDVNWKPQVNARLSSLEDRMLNLDKQLAEQNKTVILEIRKVRDSINDLDKTVALAVQARVNLEERFEKLEDKR